MHRNLDTSRAAYRTVIPRLNEKQQEVLDLLQQSVPLTNREIAAKLGWEVNTVTPRVLELREMGKVRDVGKKPDHETKRMAYLWAAMGKVLEPEPVKEDLVDALGPNGVVRLPRAVAREKRYRIL